MFLHTFHRGANMPRILSEMDDIKMGEMYHLNEKKVKDLAFLYSH